MFLRGSRELAQTVIQYCLSLYKEKSVNIVGTL